MALKKKITKAEFDKLAKHFQDEYAADGDSYKLDVDGDEDVTALKNAKDHEKAERKNAEKLLREANAKLEEIEEAANKGKGDVTALENSYKAKLETQRTELQAKIDKHTATITKNLVGAEAVKIAMELAPKAHKLLIPFLEKRMQADFEGEEPKTRILDAAGKPSAMTFEDLKKEFVDNKDFSSIIVASKASGGAGGDNKSGGAPQNNKPADLGTMSPKDLAATLKAAKGE